MNLSRRFRNQSALVVLAAAMVFLYGPVVQAQQEAAQPGKAAAKKAAGKAASSDGSETNDSIMEMIFDSGATGLGFMGVLGLFSLFAATVAIERALATRRERFLPSRFLEELHSRLQSGRHDSQSLRELCSQWTVPVANVLQAGLLRYGRPLPEIEKSMEDAAAREMASVRSRIRPLSIVGSVAPLVGLLGTVVGMIIAFRTASQAGLGKAQLLAQGIYMALLTTAAGLTIAIPCLLLSAFFNGKVDRYFREIDENLMPTLPNLAQEESGSAAQQHQPGEEPAFASVPQEAGAGS